MKDLQRKINKLYILVCLIAVAAIFAGCSVPKYTDNSKTDSTDDNIFDKAGSSQIDEISIIDNVDIYSKDEPDSIVYFYVTVRYGSEADNTNHTFSEVNNAVRFSDGAHYDSRVFARALVQVGDEDGSAVGMFGYGETESNATIRIRGNSSSLLPVKSYKLSLDDNAGLWRGQSNIALNKHGFDVTRFRNKLYFDALKEIEAVPSVRTQFVRLFIKDETSGENEFKDYGIYTQAEVPTKKYLKNHGMDSSGYLYKAISFNFEPDDAIKNTDDPEYDSAAMENVISCRGREDNRKLIELINMVNDTSVDINDVIDTYFDRDNYEYWMAYNILMGNLDTTMQNFYLYSPLNGNKWYFIPWDGDASLYMRQWELTGEDKNYAPWQCGISNYWGVRLHQRFLKYESNREELKDKIEELHSWLNEDYINEKAAEYDNVIGEYVIHMPDLLHLSYTVEERNYIISTLGQEIEDNYRKFYESLDALMPFFMYEPEERDENVTFSWGEAYDFDGEKVKYTFTLSRYPDLSEPVYTADNINTEFLEVDRNILDEGQYYWCVTAVNESGKTSQAMNSINVGEEYYTGVTGYYNLLD